MSSYLSLPTLVDIIDATQLAVSTGDTWKAALFDDSLTIDPETFTAYGVAPFNAGEASGGGYSAGGVTITPTWAVQSGTQRARWSTGVVAYTNVVTDFRYVLHYDDTLAGNNALYVKDLGALFDVGAGTDVNLSPPTNGWFRIRGVAT